MPVSVDNVASVTPNPAPRARTGVDGEDTFEASPQTAQLTIEVQAPTTPAQGGAITYTVVVTNTSAFTTANATFSIPVPGANPRRRGLDSSDQRQYHGDSLPVPQPGPHGCHSGDHPAG